MTEYYNKESEILLPSKIMPVGRGVSLNWVNVGFRCECVRDFHGVFLRQGIGHILTRKKQLLNINNLEDKHLFCFVCTTPQPLSPTLSLKALNTTFFENRQL